MSFGRGIVACWCQQCRREIGRDERKDGKVIAGHLYCADITVSRRAEDP